MKELFSWKTEKSLPVKSVLTVENLIAIRTLSFARLTRIDIFVSDLGLEFFETSAKENVNVKVVFER